MALFILFLFVCRHYEAIDLEVLNYQDSYENLGVDSSGIVIHFILSCISFFCIFCIGFLIPLKTTPFTMIGRNTMSVYLLHGIIYKYISLGMNVLDYVDGRMDLLIYIILIIGLVYGLSVIPLNRYLNELYDRITGIPKRIYKWIC